MLVFLSRHNTISGICPCDGAYQSLQLSFKIQKPTVKTKIIRPINLRTHQSDMDPVLSLVCNRKGRKQNTRECIVQNSLLWHWIQIIKGDAEYYLRQFLVYCYSVNMLTNCISDTLLYHAAGFIFAYETDCFKKAQ